MLKENCSPRSREESNLDLQVIANVNILGLSGLVGLPVGESASVVDVHLVPRPRLALTLAINLHKSVVDIPVDKLATSCLS